MHSGWDFLDRQPRIWIRIVCLFEGPACGQFKRCAFEGGHICTGHVSHDVMLSFSKATLVMQPHENAEDVLTRSFPEGRAQIKGTSYSRNGQRRPRLRASFEVRATPRILDRPESPNIS
jgi:hypothetical protein